jgi:hypothetical protein
MGKWGMKSLAFPRQAMGWMRMLGWVMARCSSIDRRERPLCAHKRVPGGNVSGGGSGSREFYFAQKMGSGKSYPCAPICFCDVLDFATFIGGSGRRCVGGCETWVEGIFGCWRITDCAPYATRVPLPVRKPVVTRGRMRIRGWSRPETRGLLRLGEFFAKPAKGERRRKWWGTRMARLPTQPR